MVLKRVPKKEEPKTKPKLKRVGSSKKSLVRPPLRVAPTLLDFCDYYTGKYKGNFPWKPVKKHSEVIFSEKRLKEVADQMMRLPEFAFDTETNTLEVLGRNSKFKLVGISISWGEDNNYYIPTGHIRDEDIDRQLTVDVVVRYLKPVFERTNVRIIGHNLKFDFHVLKRIGINIFTRDIFDTMLASWICDENSPNGLKENTTSKMGVEQTHFKDVTQNVPNDVKKKFGYKANSKVPFELVLIDEGAPYAIDDAFYTWCNYLGFRNEIIDEEMDKIYYKVSVPFLFTLFDMEEQGVAVDVDRLKEMGREMQKDIDELQYKIYELSGVEFNIGSPAQKSLLLYGIDDYTMSFEEYLAKYKKKNAKKLAKSKNGLDVKSVKKKFEDKQNDPERRAILNNCFGFKPTAYTDSGNPSTDGDAIWRISTKTYKTNKRKQQGADMCKLLLEYSKLSKLKTAFVDGILEQLYEDGKAHPSFNQIGTDSGRLSCSKPNLQQLPKAEDDDKYQIRSVFIGSPYVINKFTGAMFDIEEYEIDKYINKPEDFTVKRKKIIALDYHNLEMVCLTHFSGDKNLSEMFANDDDAHGSTAVNMFSLDCTPMEAKKKYPHLRQAAKTINFLLMYGGGATLLYENLKNDHFSPLDLGAKEYLQLYHCKNGIQVAQAFIDKYFTSYSGVAKFIQSQKKYAHRHGYVYTILGRKRRLPDINSRDGGVSSYCERLSVNSSIQGTAGDITISAQNRVYNEERLKEVLCYMLIQVHDELVFECPEEFVEECIPIIKYDMEHPFGDSDKKQVKYLRADYDVGDSYQEAK